MYTSNNLAIENIVKTYSVNYRYHQNYAIYTVEMLSNIKVTNSI